MPPVKRPGIFCLEGEWDPDLRRRNTVQPVLELLDKLEIAKFIRRDVATAEECEFYVKKWTQARYDDYVVLYLAAHGDQGGLGLGKDDVTLDDLIEWIGGNARGGIIYFGSCLTLDLDDDGALLDLVRRTDASAVIGYRKVIDWVESAAFDVLLLERLMRGNRSDALFNHLIKDHGSYAESLGLVVATKTKVLDAYTP